MPSAPPTICKCGGRRTNGVCDKCGPAKRTKHKQTTTQRGYGWDWQRMVASRKHDPACVLCDDCLAMGIVNVATERHHIRKIKDDPSSRLDHANIMDLCGACHDRRTARGE